MGDWLRSFLIADHVVYADAAPSAAVLLPMPSVVCHVRQISLPQGRDYFFEILAQSYKNFLTWANFRGKICRCRIVFWQMDETIIQQIYTCPIHPRRIDGDRRWGERRLRGTWGRRRKGHSLLCHSQRLRLGSYDRDLVSPIR